MGDDPIDDMPDCELDELDVCDHGTGFDEDCEWCEYEIQAEAEAQRSALRAARDPQADLFGPQQPQPGAERG